MTVIEQINLKTRGLTDIIDITSEIEALLKKNKIKNGIANIHCAGSTGGISSIEYEPGLKKDIKAYLETLFPYKDHYEHHNTWNDDNGAAHVRSFFIKTSLTVPFQEKELILGTWQQIVFVDFDTRARSRTLFITLIGD